MVSSVKEAFTNNFQHLGWMDNDTRRVTRGKVDAIADEIGIFVSNCDVS